MAIYVEASRLGPDWRYRLWDTQTETCASDCLSRRGIGEEIKRLLIEGGVAESPDMEAAISIWIGQAAERGTNDLSQMAVDESLRHPFPGDLDGPTAGPMRRALRACVLSKQAMQAILEIRVAEWTAILSPDAQALLAKSYVIHELLRDKGKAVMFVDRRQDAYKGIANVRQLVAEITAAWSDAVTVETVDPANSNSTVYAFRLR